MFSHNIVCEGVHIMADDPEEKGAYAEVSEIGFLESNLLLQ